MSETGGKTASCLAITEKKAHRAGGCAGIFFQLFDWNRVFAKTKLFSGKLLPPVRGQSSKKFRGDEKMHKSKLQLIAEENSGGFPSVKKNGKHNGGGDREQRHEMRAPTLVARLMGLESMPAVHRDKSKKASGGNCGVRDENLVNSPSRFKGDDLILEKGNVKVEPRSQKIQKRGQYERRVVPRFGAEALQIKSVFSRSSKHRSPKLAVPVKSPRISAARASRLIDAATKILEPRLQATSKAKCALTYSTSMPYASKTEVISDRMGAGSPDVLKQSGYNLSLGMSSMGQVSCKSCGNFLHDVSTRPDLEDQNHVYPPFVLDLVDAYPQELQKGKPQPIVSSADQGRGATLQRSQERLEFVASQEEDSLQSSGEFNVDRKTLFRGVQAQQPLTSHEGNHLKDEQYPFALKHQTETPNKMSLGRNKIPPGAKLSNVQGKRASSDVNTVSGTKNFVALNKSLQSHTRPRVATKVDDSFFNTNKRSYNCKDDYSSHLRSAARKRTTVNGQVDSSDFVTSTYGKQRNVRCNAMTGNGMGLGACSIDSVCLKGRLASKHAGTGANSNKDTGLVSFTRRQRTGNFTENESAGNDQQHTIPGCNSDQRKLTTGEKDGKTVLQKKIPLTADHFGVLLEQKLKELTFQEEDELTTGSTPPKRSTAMILQELITALTAVQPGPEDVSPTSPDSGFQAKAKAEGTLVRLPCYGDHLSPGSVLEASFSNHSCVSNSLDDSSGYGLRLDYIDYLYHHPQPTEPDVDLLDFATTLDKGRAVSEMVTDLLNKISRTLRCINQAGLRLSGDKLIHIKEVILNAELLFGNLPPFDSDGKEDLLLGSFLHEEIEPLSGPIWTGFCSLFGFETTKDNNQLKLFLLDSAVECLDSRYGQYCNLGFRAWRRLPLRMDSKMLMQEVAKEVTRWTRSAGKLPDELIESEMSRSLGKWIDFDIEAFETGTKIDFDILEILLEEVVVDLWDF
ncbi:hypothetical protein SLE2022_275640 [Rubroshorea leprosula]